MIREVMGSLPKERTLFWYFKDRYAPYLLQKELEERGPRTVGELKRCRFAKLLQKTVCKPLVSQAGNRPVMANEFAAIWPEVSKPYVLTVDKWGGLTDFHWNQTSVPGWNLVLQMNFSNEHDHEYRCLFGKDFDHFEFYSHPVHRGKRNTLAWARIDLDFNEGVALIEEIQTDWIREARDAFKDATEARKAKKNTFKLWSDELDVGRMCTYYERVLTSHTEQWAEAMLTAAVSFIRDELGFKTIFYHSYETGKSLKHIGRRGPPRSLYTELPKKFCFEETDQGPQFVVTHKEVRRMWKKLKYKKWFVLNL
ncbi:hypothetical protein BTA51_05865 [Hahella sp. CCB-MM4]|uniref:hypothetical protein n=1 Tax=Hahella sp. (strain CCB-MM4) TaxID=1926491 RepID=UPI000B9A87C5|nr:hypothetical protein [Hahella sp. CCB-MM4]OZG74525.1 hypothetical protein BTA51_05865 [Hahella sp. CCB-MM4]